MAHRTGKATLHSGQTLSLHLARGTMLAAIAGRIRIDGPPRWLAEQVIPEQTELGEGSSHVMPDTGWIMVTALSAAEVAWIVQEKAGWLARLRQGLSGRLRPGLQPRSPVAQRS